MDNNAAEGWQGIGYNLESGSLQSNHDTSYAQQWQHFHLQQQRQQDPNPQQQQQKHDPNPQKQQQQHILSPNVSTLQAVQNAQAIALRFHAQAQSAAAATATSDQVVAATNGASTTLGQLSAVPTPHHVTSTATIAGIGRPFAIPATNDTLSRCRQRYEGRLRKSFLKNLEYISRKDEEALQQQLLELERTRHLSARLDDRSRHDLEQRAAYQSQTQKRRRENNGGAESSALAAGGTAGVGTGVRKKQQRQQHEQVYGHVARSEAEKRSRVYVSGIRVEKKTAEEVETSLTQLFVLYGKIQYVKLYKDSKSGMLKGDALITYDVVVDVSLVCSQLNGAELPCGSVLDVQPANFDAKKKKQSELDNTTYTVGSRIMSNLTAGNGENDPGKGKSNDAKNKETESKAQVADDDLDDFFDSLS